MFSAIINLLWRKLNPNFGIARHLFRQDHHHNRNHNDQKNLDMEIDNIWRHGAVYGYGEREGD